MEKVRTTRRKDEAGKNPNKKIIYLRAGEECVGFYQRLQVSKEGITVILSLSNGKSVDIPFPIGSTEEEIIRRELRSVKTGNKISILKIDDVKTPVLIRRLPLAKRSLSNSREDKRKVIKGET